LLHSVIEKYQVQLIVGGVVVFMLLVLQQLVKLARISHLFIKGNSRIKFDDVREKNGESLIGEEADIREISLIGLGYHSLEPSIVVFDHAVREHSPQLMHENLHDEFLLALPNILYYLPHVSHVVNVLEFRGRWQQLL
jgi:hypothetical protein